MSQAIRVERLSKSFRVPVAGERRDALGRFLHFLRRPTTEAPAVREVSFGIERGEMVGFLGANGSGKSTTIKLLTGILTPSAGEAEVLGYVPWLERREYTRHIGVVMGQKSLLWWNIPVLESFKLYRDIYGISDEQFRQQVERFSRLLEIDEILHVPVRKLSLGLRMRAEIAASLLHRPEVIFLDEPTIGLDVLARMRLKDFLRRVNEELGVTLLLTTHNMGDVEDLCRRCLILESGRLIYDGAIASLKVGEGYQIVEFDVEAVLDERRFQGALARGSMVSKDELSYKIQVPNAEASGLIEQLLSSCRLSDLHVLPPTLESIIGKIFDRRDGRAGNGQPLLPTPV